MHIKSCLAAGVGGRYFLKVVPTLYTDLRNRTISTNQFSVTEYFKPADPSLGQYSLPGAAPAATPAKP